MENEKPEEIVLSDEAFRSIVNELPVLKPTLDVDSLIAQLPEEYKWIIYSGPDPRSSEEAMDAFLASHSLFYMGKPVGPFPAFIVTNQALAINVSSSGLDVWSKTLLAKILTGLTFGRKVVPGITDRVVKRELKSALNGRINKAEHIAKAESYVAAAIEYLQQELAASGELNLTEITEIFNAMLVIPYLGGPIPGTPEFDTVLEVARQVTAHMDLPEETLGRLIQLVEYALNHKGELARSLEGVIASPELTLGQLIESRSIAASLLEHYLTEDGRALTDEEQEQKLADLKRSNRTAFRKLNQNLPFLIMAAYSTTHVSLQLLSERIIIEKNSGSVAYAKFVEAANTLNSGTATPEEIAAAEDILKAGLHETLRLKMITSSANRESQQPVTLVDFGGGKFSYLTDSQLRKFLQQRANGQEEGNPICRHLKGTKLTMDIELMNMHSDNHERPLEFDPSRYIDDRGRYKTPTGNLSFGYGPTTCVGMPHAERTAVAYAAKFIQMIAHRNVDIDSIEMKTVTAGANTIPDDIHMYVEPSTAEA